MPYETLQPERFSVRFVDGKEQLEIPARKNSLVLLFLIFWISIWTIGGIMSLYQLLNDFSLFFVFWLFGWALGWLFVVGTIGWQLTGKEIVRIIGGDLAVGYRLLGYEKMKLYRGADIRQLNVESSSRTMWPGQQLSVPFYKQANFGSVKFNYGARTERFGSGLDEAEGKLIVEKLLPRLPLSTRS